MEQITLKVVPDAAKEEALDLHHRDHLACHVPKDGVDGNSKLGLIFVLASKIHGMMYI